MVDTIYEQHIEEINNDVVNLLGPAVDNKEEVTIEEKEDLDYIEENCDEYRPDWMILTKMGPNARIEISSDLGSRDSMDRNHD